MDRARMAGGVVAVCAVAAVALSLMGRVLWCSCGSWVPWSFDTWSLHNSQHVLDPYTFSHVLHGVLFYAVLRVGLRGRHPQVGLVIAAGMEAVWEIVENSEAVIQRYRENTVSLDYHGDSVANSVSDILACSGGYLLAWSLPAWGSVAVFVVTELVLLAWIRDSLLVNVLMLVWPVQAVKDWQVGG